MAKSQRQAEQKQHSHSRLEDLLREARHRKGLSLAKVAQVLNLKSTQPVWDWENGKGSGLPSKYLRKIIKLYELDVNLVHDAMLEFQLCRAEKRIRQKLSEELNLSRQK